MVVLRPLRYLGFRVREGPDNREPKINEFRSFAPMFVQQVPVYFANQNPPLLGAPPGREGHKIDSRHHTDRTKIMPQIMKADPFEPCRPTRDFQTFTKTSCVLIARSPLWRREKPRAIWRASRMHFAQKRAKLRIKFHGAAFPIFR